MESSGCQVLEGPSTKTDLRSYEILFPGEDKVLLLNSNLQRQFWDRAELRVDQARDELRVSWNYGTPGQLLLHAVLTLTVFVSVRPETFRGCLLLAVLANLIPIGLSRWEGLRFHRKILKAGFVSSKKGHS